MRRSRVLALVLTVVLAACGDGGDDDEVSGTQATEPPTSAPTTTAVAAQETVAVGQTPLGEVLVDAEGLTLYLFTRDSGGASQCAGQCAQTWPPLTVRGEPTAGPGLDAAKMGTITRDDGSSQVTYGGHPLYRYSADQASGDTKGQGVGGVWFAVSPAGEAMASEGG